MPSRIHEMRSLRPETSLTRAGEIRAALASVLHDLDCLGEALAAVHVQTAIDLIDLRIADHAGEAPEVRGRHLLADQELRFPAARR